MIIAPFIQGFGAGGGLIMAIGAQNAFVLSQGVRGSQQGLFVEMYRSYLYVMYGFYTK